MADKIIVPDLRDSMLNQNIDPSAPTGKIEQLVDELYTTIQKFNLKGASKAMSQIVSQLGDKHAISGICYMIAGFIRLEQNKTDAGIKQWGKALQVLPLGKTFHATKMALLTNPHHKTLELFIETVINFILREENPPPLGRQLTMTGKNQGVYERWDDYMARRLLEKSYSDPARLIGITDDNGEVVEVLLRDVNFQTLSESELTHLNQLGRFYKQQGRTDLAIEAYRTVVALRPDSNAGYYNMGKLYYLNGMMDEAISSYLRCLHLEVNLAAYSDNPNIRRQFEIQLSTFSPEFLGMLESNHPPAKFMLFDTNTLNHLGHAIADRARVGIAARSDYIKYKGNYLSLLSGKDGLAIPPDIQQNCVMLALNFGSIFLDWADMMSIDVYSRYNDATQFSYQEFKQWVL